MINYTASIPQLMIYAIIFGLVLHTASVIMVKNLSIRVFLLERKYPKVACTYYATMILEESKQNARKYMVKQAKKRFFFVINSKKQREKARTRVTASSKGDDSAFIRSGSDGCLAVTYYPPTPPHLSNNISITPINLNLPQGWLNFRYRLTHIIYTIQNKP